MGKKKKKKNLSKAPLCACGWCDEKVNWNENKKQWNKYIWGHARRGAKVNVKYV